jgi:protein-disulfide isomerase
VPRNITRKIQRQLVTRGWTVEEIDDVLSQPFAMRPALNRATGNAGTAYFRSDGHYVVRDNATADIIQISNRNDPNWIPDPAIQQR